MEHPTKILLDMDGDGDNLIALAYALQSDALEVLGVTTCHGFVSVETASAAVTAFLDAMGAKVPVAMGADRPLMRQRMPKVIREAPAAVPAAIEPLPAWDFMAQVLEESPEPVTVCLLGPATNLVQLLHRHPEAAGKIQRVLFAGGSFAFGTVTASACHKVYFDAEAMQRLTHAGIPFYMASVDVTSGFTNGVKLEELLDSWSGSLWARARRLMPSPVPATRFVRTPFALLSLDHPEMFSFGRYKCEVELHGRITYGMTVVYLDNFDGVFELPDGTTNRRDVAEEDKNIWYMDAFDRDKVLAILSEVVGGLSGTGGAV